MRFEVSEIMKKDQVMDLVYGNSCAPKNVLGRHYVKNGQVISAYHPDAVSVEVIDEQGKIYEMDMVERQQVFVLYLPWRVPFSYKLKMTFRDGNTFTSYDPYSFPCQISEKEEENFLKGEWLKAYQKLGCHPACIGGVKGMYFAVWAPSARRVSVVGDFNFWNGLIYPMHRLEDSGIYELFLPGLTPDHSYKFEVKTMYGEVYQKVDPCGVFMENNTSKMLDIKAFAWEDATWMKNRKYKNVKDIPLAVCDVMDGSGMGTEELFQGDFTHILFSQNVGDREKERGYTPSQGLYYVPYCGGSPDRFREMINEAHQHNVGVLMEISPEYYCREDSDLKKFDGTSLYGFADDRVGVDEKRGMRRFFLGRPEVANYIFSSLLFWMREYHIDGFVFEGITSIISPMEDESMELNACGFEELGAVARENRAFLRKMIAVIRKSEINILVIADEKAEEVNRENELFSIQNQFDYVWNYSVKRSMDAYLFCGEEDRRKEHFRITFPLQKAGLENSLLLLNPSLREDFPDSLIDNPFFVDYDKLAQEKMSAAYLLGVPGRKVWTEGKAHESVRAYVRSLLRIYRKYPALHEYDIEEASFEWINGVDAQSSVVSFIRKAPAGRCPLLFVSNFSREEKGSYQIGVPKYGRYVLISSSDAAMYGGRGRYEKQCPAALRERCDFRPYSIYVSLPPITTLIFEYAPL